MEYVLAGILSATLAVVSLLAGGGGNLIMTPALILFGFGPATVLASQKAGGIGINFGAAVKFIRHKDLINFRVGLIAALIASVVAFFGVNLVADASEETVRIAVAVVVIIVVIANLARPKLGLQRKRTSVLSKVVGYVVLGFILMLQAGFGSGLGLLTMYVYMFFIGLPIKQANVTKRFVGLALTIVSFIFFSFTGLINWALAGVLLIGSMTGGYIGASLVVKHKPEVIKKALLIVSVLLALSLFIN